MITIDWQSQYWKETTVIFNWLNIDEIERRKRFLAEINKSEKEARIWSFDIKFFDERVQTVADEELLRSVCWSMKQLMKVDDNESSWWWRKTAINCWKKMTQRKLLTIVLTKDCERSLTKIDVVDEKLIETYCNKAVFSDVLQTMAILIKRKYWCCYQFVEFMEL